MKKVILFLIIFTLVVTAYLHAQVAITSYSVNALGVNTNKIRKVSGELKSFLNREINSTLFEVSGMYNFQRKSVHQFSIGLGLNATPFAKMDQFNCVTIPMQFEIFPLQTLKQLSIIFEITPEFYDEGSVNMRQLWGIRYSFNKK